MQQFYTAINYFSRIDYNVIITRIAKNAKKKNIY